MPGLVCVCGSQRCDGGVWVRFRGVCFVSQYGLCVQCPTIGRGVSMLASILLPLGLVAVFGALFVLRAMAPRGLMKVGISMLQILANANSVYTIPWPSDFSNLLDVMKIFLIGIKTGSGVFIAWC